MIEKDSQLRRDRERERNTKRNIHYLHQSKEIEIKSYIVVCSTYLKSDCKAEMWLLVINKN